MGTIPLRVALALLLVAVLGQARSFPALRAPGSAPLAKPPNDDDYDYEKSYKDDPSYYPDEEDDYEYDDSLEDCGSSVDKTIAEEVEEKDDDDEEEEEEEEASSKERRQYKGNVIQEQNGDVKYDVDGAGYDQWQPVINQLDDEIRAGVQPLPPVQAPDISKGVEAVDDEGEDGSFSNWWGGGWHNFVNAVGKAGDHIDDTFSGAVNRIQGAAHSAGSSIVEAYNNLKHKFTELREKIHHLFSSFGLMVQRGADYCIQHLQHTANQVREAQLLDKLQKKLKEGNEQVTAFFTILGEKVTAWAQSQGHEDVDEGLILVSSHLGQGGTNGAHTEDEDGNREQVFPNLFQDQDVLGQMNKMVEQGVITQGELDLLYQQTERVVKPQQQDQGIRVESHTRRRNLRSRIVVL